VAAAGGADVPEVAAPAAPVKLSPEEALQGVLQRAAIADGLRRGLHECVKELDRKTARLCCLAEDCQEGQIVTLVKALCKQNNIPLMPVPKREQLGMWCGLVKFQALEETEEGEEVQERKVRKIVKTSVAVVTDFGEASIHLNALNEHLQKGGK